MLKINNLKAKKNTEERGITLVALTITIIVLLILAGVSINAIFGDSGLINNAKKAKENAEIASEIEYIQQASIIAIAESRTGDFTVEEMQDAMDKTVRNRKNNNNR